MLANVLKVLERKMFKLVPSLRLTNASHPTNCNFSFVRDTFVWLRIFFQHYVNKFDRRKNTQKNPTKNIIKKNTRKNSLSNPVILF